SERRRQARCREWAGVVGGGAVSRRTRYQVRLRCVSRAGGAARSIVVAQVGGQPAFADAEVLLLARAVALDLVLVDLAHREVLRLRMGEVPATDGGSREHRVMLGEEHTAAARLVERRLGIEQLEQRRLL